MKFRIPDHAKMRIEQRGIDVDNAKKVIHSPDVKREQRNGRIEATGKLKDGRTLTIIYVQESKNTFTIITGYYEN